MKHPFVLLLALLAPGVPVVAHGYLVNSTPGANAVVRTAPAGVKLAFTEGIELRLSTFKVYPLEAPADLLSSPARLKALAEPLVRRVLSLKGDEAARADTGLKTQGRTSENLELGLKPDLKPGAYVVMWRALSVDTHTTQDFFVFIYRP